MSEENVKLTVSPSPHKRSVDTTRSIMLDVIIALMPALIMSVVLFGFRSLLVTAVSVLSCVLFEYIARKVMKRDNTIGDLSAVVTGILLAFNLPSTMPIWMVIIGDAVAIIVAKQFFGGIGQNFVNPALAGRIVLMTSFANAMSDYPAPFAWRNAAVDAVTSATPLSQMTSVYKAGDIDAAINAAGLPTLTNMFFGVREGCLGENVRRRAASRIYLSLNTQGNISRNSALFCRHSCRNNADSGQGQSYLYGISALVGRPFARCCIYGYRLQYLADKRKGKNNICRGMRNCNVSH